MIRGLETRFGGTGRGRDRGHMSLRRDAAVAFLIALSLGSATVLAAGGGVWGAGSFPPELAPTPPAKPAPEPGRGETGRGAVDRGEAGRLVGGGRTGGDTFATAVVIPSIPYTDSGTTCGFADDWDEVCPYSGSTSPDVICRFDCAATVEISAELCASTYDTKLSIHDGAYGTAIACNDDGGCGYSGWQSRLDQVTLQAGHTYFFVVDGYSGCGDYVLSIEQYVPCVVNCPPDATSEGEPLCGDGYVDRYNGGCAAGLWSEVEADSAGCVTLCGRSCTYLHQGLSYRDSDWYRLFAAGGPVTATVQAEFPVSMFLIHGTDCMNLAYVPGDALSCRTLTLDRSSTEGQELWVWVGPTTYRGVPESVYMLQICGLRAPVPVRKTSWGRLKAHPW